MIRLGKVGQALALASAIALGSAGVSFAQGAAETSNSNSVTNPKPSVKTEQVVSQQEMPYIMREADGNLFSNDVTVLERGKDHNLRKRFDFGKSDKIYAMNPITGLENMITAMGGNPEEKGNPVVEGKFSWQRKPFIINDYKRDIAIINSYPKSENYTQSLENLSSAVSDGELTSQEMNSVDGGFYMLKGDYNSTYGKPAIIYIPQKIQTSQTTPETQSQSSEYKSGSEKPYAETSESRSTSENKTLVSLIAGANTNLKTDYVEGNLGFQVRPFTNKDIALGAVANLGYFKDRKVNSYQDSLPLGITTSGIETWTNTYSLGLALEVQYKNLLLGVGADKIIFNDNTTASIYQNGQEIKSNSDSKSGSQIGWRLYGGYDLPLSDIMGLRAVAGYGVGKGFFGGLSARINLNSK